MSNNSISFEESIASNEEQRKGRSYTGSEVVAVEDTPFRSFGAHEWTMYFIEHFGQNQEPQHKAWVIDQIARAQKGCEPIITLAKWTGGHEEYIVTMNKLSDEYLEWVGQMRKDDNTLNSAHYTCGFAPQ